MRPVNLARAIVFEYVLIILPVESIEYKQIDKILGHTIVSIRCRGDQSIRDHNELGTLNESNRIIKMTYRRVTKRFSMRIPIPQVSSCFQSINKGIDVVSYTMVENQ